MLVATICTPARALVSRLLAQEPHLGARVRLLFQPAEELAQGRYGCGMRGRWRASMRCTACMWCRICRWARWDPAGLSHGGGRRAGDPGARRRWPWCPSPSVGGCGLAGGSGDHSFSRPSPVAWTPQPVVISFGKVEGGRAFNVIADQVRLLGTVRCLDLQQHAQLPAWLMRRCRDRASGGYGCGDYRCIAPPVHNDPKLTTCRTLCGGVSGATGAAGGAPSLGAEDFAELLRDVPGMMVRLGVAGPEGCAAAELSLEEDALGVGIAVLTPPCWRGSRRTPRHEPTSCGDWLGAPLLILLAVLPQTSARARTGCRCCPPSWVG